MVERYPVSLPVPPEIESFFETHAGEVLLIKGSTGSGKTLLGLQIISKLSERDRGIMLFTRVEEDQLTVQFPHLKPTSPLRKKVALYDKNSRISDPNWFLREFTDLFKVEEKPKVVLMDTIDSLIERFENPSRMIRATLDVVQQENLSLIMVTEESGKSFLDPLVGGIVHLDFTEVDGRKIREMEIVKMRGVEIKQKKYLFTLKGGEFRVFKPSATLERRSQWERISHPEGYYSTGIKELDDALGGGFRKGSYVMIETSFEVSEQMLMMLINPIVLNFIANGGVVFITPPGGEAPETIYSELQKYLPEEILKNSIRFVDYFRGDTTNPLVVPVTDRASQRMYKKTLESLTEGFRRPLLDLVGLDTLEYRVDKTVTPHDLIGARVFIKMNGYLAIAISRPNLKIASAAANFSDIVLRYQMKDNTPILYGEKPPTGVMVPIKDPVKDMPWIKLVDLL
ncbi:MAG: hypothetical protein J7L88_01390 [Thermoplasmata archaeon]|nr:hypothetical protein [Thermoplasmata archaeon]